MNAPTAIPVPRPAATVMLVRDAPAAPLVFMTRRSSRSAFNPDAYVFPGGARDDLDATEAVSARVRGRTACPDRALVVTAVRELFEEAGVLLARDRAGAFVSGSALAAIGASRPSIADGTVAFSGLLAEHDLAIDASDLIYYSNWITPPGETRRFDAHFFLAVHPAGQTAIADAVEVHDGRWIAARDALAEADAGTFSIIFPTRKHLERLARFSSVADLIADARTRTIAPVLPQPVGDGTFSIGERNDSW